MFFPRAEDEWRQFLIRDTFRMLQELQARAEFARPLFLSNPDDRGEEVILKNWKPKP